MHKFSKRTLAVVVPTAALSLAGIAYAATLSVSSTQLGGGNAPVAVTCAVDVSYDGADLAYDNEANGYVLSKVTVSPSGAACNGLDWRVTVADGEGESLGEATGTFASPAAAMDDKALTATEIPALADSIVELYATVTK